VKFFFGGGINTPSKSPSFTGAKSASSSSIAAESLKNVPIASTIGSSVKISLRGALKSHLRGGHPYQSNPQFWLLQTPLSPLPVEGSDPQGPIGAGRLHHHPRHQGDEKSTALFLLELPVSDESPKSMPLPFFLCDNGGFFCRGSIIVLPESESRWDSLAAEANEGTNFLASPAGFWFPCTWGLSLFLMLAFGGRYRFTETGIGVIPRATTELTTVREEGRFGEALEGGFQKRFEEIEISEKRGQDVGKQKTEVMFSDVRTWGRSRENGQSQVHIYLQTT
ncbi:unnamed protein product, partial [Thlaspi arvense]